MNIGGVANYFKLCTSVYDLRIAISWSNKMKIPWFIIGNGSNILFSDDGFHGLVIKLVGNFMRVNINNNSIIAGSGVLLPSLSRHCLANCWSGFEFMCGIPGTIGGAVRMNAGTKQGEIKDHFVSATVLTHDGAIKNLSKEDMQFSYRHSILAKTRDILLSATFAKHKVAPKEDIQKTIKEIIASRRQKQPRIKRNCGSVFKSPPGNKPAGWYIEQVGLKGFRVGDAMISYEHANWIVNLGNAKAYDVKSIISYVEYIVLQKFNVCLEREVLYIPEDL